MTILHIPREMYYRWKPRELKDALVAAGFDLDIAIHSHMDMDTGQMVYRQDGSPHKGYPCDA